MGYRDKPNPLLVLALEELAKFNRPSKPITFDEYLKLHQISLFIQDKVKTGQLPQEFETVIPDHVKDISHSEYAKFD